MTNNKIRKQYWAIVEKALLRGGNNDIVIAANMIMAVITNDVDKALLEWQQANSVGLCNG